MANWWLSMPTAGPVWPIRGGPVKHGAGVRCGLSDVLYHAGHCLMHEPLTRRRDVLAELCQRLDTAEVRFSEAVVGQGRALYAAALAQGHEGVLAQHVTSC
jgi:hypothetical protein